MAEKVKLLHGGSSMDMSRLGSTALIALFCLLPLLALATPVAATHGDECAGGADANEGTTDATPLAVYAGCKGQFYNNPGNSSQHQDDYRDHYSVRVSGTGTAQIHFRVCNEAKAGVFFYEVYWNSDVLPAKRHAFGLMDVGQCSSQDPAVLKGDYRPGHWEIYLFTYEDYIADNKSLGYDLYAQPLWR